MKSNERVSVCIPCFNAEKYIEESIDSALSQNYPDVEVIVVDDGSTDGSADLITQKYGAKVKLIRAENRGAAAARNTAISHATGRYIQFLDADDFLKPEKFSVQVAQIRDNPQAMAFCRAEILATDGSISECGYYPDPASYDPFEYVLTCTIGTNGPLHHRQNILAVDGFRESLPRSQEWDLYVRMALAGLVLVSSDEVLYTIRHHDGPRISTGSASNLVYMLERYYELIALIERSPTKDKEKKLDFVAQKISLFSSHAFRNGYETDAKRGFQVARKISHHFSYQERLFVKWLARAVGPYSTERLLQIIRSIKRRMQGAH
jgi:glycosyltransferase involved in cell wall biosynthesis